MGFPYIILDECIIIYINDKPYNITKNFKNYHSVVNAIRNDNWSEVEKLVNVTKSIESFSEGKIEIVNGKVLYEGEEIHNILVDKILSLISQGFTGTSFIKFLENLLKNPSKTAVNELYSFLEFSNLPITEDGCFLAYKKVRNDYKDIHSGTFDNSVGCICKMPRRDVNDNRHETCSTGLHFCSFDYLEKFGNGNSDKVMIVKINPMNVVSIPADYNNTKGRCCEYEVVAEYKDYNEDKKEIFQEDDVIFHTETLNVDKEDIIKEFLELGPTSWEDFSRKYFKYTIAQLTKIYNHVTNKNITKFSYKYTAVEKLYSLLPKYTPHKLTKNELLEKTHKELIEIYYKLTNKKVRKFRDKNTAVERILKEQK